MNQEVQNINEVLKEHKELEAQYKKLKTVEFKKAILVISYGLLIQTIMHNIIYWSKRL